MSKSYIEVEAFVSSEQEIYCKDCARRKGIKNGKEQFIYEIGDAVCKACGVMDILDDVEQYSEAFRANVKPVVRGKWKIEHGVLHPLETDGICSVCGYTTSFYYMHNFCPNCGADMRRESDE